MPVKRLTTPSLGVVVSVKRESNSPASHPIHAQYMLVGILLGYYLTVSG